jgi:hypothetical protein
VSRGTIQIIKRDISRRIVSIIPERPSKMKAGLMVGM